MTPVHTAVPDGSFLSTGACNLELPGSNHGRDGYSSSWLCIYTVLQTVQRPGVYCAANSTIHFKEPLKRYCHDYAESDVKQYSLTHVAFCTKSWQYRDRSQPEAYYALLLFRMTSRFVDSAQYHRQHCTLSRQSLEHCICTATMTNNRLDRDSNMVPPGYKPQSIRMRHRGRPSEKQWGVTSVRPTLKPHWVKAPCLLYCGSMLTQCRLSVGPA